MYVRQAMSLYLYMDYYCHYEGEFVKEEEELFPSFAHRQGVKQSRPPGKSDSWSGTCG